VNGRRDVGQSVAAEHTRRGEELNELAAGASEPRDPREQSDLFFIVVRQEMDELQCSRPQACFPASAGPGGYGSDRAQGVAGDRATYDGPRPPQVTGDEGRQDSPRRAAVIRGADVPDNVDTTQSRLPDDDALSSVMDVKARSCTARACSGAVGIGVSKALLVILEGVHVRGDERPASEALPPREDQATFRGRGTATDNHRAWTERRHARDVSTGAGATR
jgi:hypothetical protein